MEYAIGAAIGAAAAAVLLLAFAAARAGGLGEAARGLALAGKAKHDPAFAAKLKAVVAGAELKPLVPPPPPKPSGAALRMLTVLQAEARLVDFLLEDVQAYTDEQIGQAVREVHKKARATLHQHAVIVPVLAGKEDDTVTVPKGFDPSAVRVLGNVAGEPPYIGQLQHPGWKVQELKLAPPLAGVDEFILQPAEVQVP